MSNDEQPEKRQEATETQKTEIPDKRKPYSKPELRRLGKLGEISKKGPLLGSEVLVLLRS
jgi:hypothetical protein